MMGSIIPPIVRCEAEASSGVRALRCNFTFGPPNKSMQRSVNHEVLGRGRGVSVPFRVPRARVLKKHPAAAELSR